MSIEETEGKLLSIEEFAAILKKKYSAYENVDDSTLVNKWIEKYPVYKKRLDLEKKSADVVEEEQEPISFPSTAVDVSSNTEMESEEVPTIVNEDAVVEDPNPITTEESELLELFINPHSMAMTAIGKEVDVDVNSLTETERQTYGQVYSQYQSQVEKQNNVQEREDEKNGNVNKYAIPVENYMLPGLVPSLSNKTTYNPVPGSYNYSYDESVIIDAQTIIDNEMPKAIDRFQKIFKNPKDYNLQSDITTATPEELSAAWKIFNKQNNRDKDGFFERDRNKHVNLKESYLEGLFNQQYESAKLQYQESRDRKVSSEKKEDIKRRKNNGELTEAQVRNINLSEQTSYDYDNMSTDEKSYVDSTKDLEVIQKKLAKENLDPDVKIELENDLSDALTRVATAKVGLGGDRDDNFYDIQTGARVEKINKKTQVNLTKEIEEAEKETISFKGTIEDNYLDAANREEDHRIWGKESRRDIEIKDPTSWRLLGKEVVKLENGNFQVKNISLSEANLNPDAILNESVRKEALEWSNKNRQNIASRHVWKDMALLNVDPGKVDKNIITRGLEIIGNETIGEALTEKIGMSDQKYVDIAIEELQNQGIELNQSQADNMERSDVMEFTEAGSGFLPILGKMAIGNKVLGVTGAAGWLKTTISGLNNAKKLKRWNKFRGYLLGATAEEAQMQVYGFETGTGFGFHTAGKFLPAGKVFKFTGELARLNKVGNMVFESGFKGASALEFATHVESIVQDMEGGTEYGAMIREQYPDVSTVVSRVLLNAAVFSFYGAAGLVGKGKSGMNIKNMETAIVELKEKGYKEEAVEIQKQVDLYYEGKKELPKEEQEILTKHENGQLELDFDTQLSEKELDARLKEMGGKEIKPEAEVKAEVKQESDTQYDIKFKTERDIPGNIVKSTSESSFEVSRYEKGELYQPKEVKNIKEGDVVTDKNGQAWTITGVRDNVKSLGGKEFEVKSGAVVTSMQISQLYKAKSTSKETINKEAKPEVKAEAEVKAEVKPEVKTEPTDLAELEKKAIKALRAKINPKAEPKVESKVESKVEPVEVKKDKEDKRTTINNKVEPKVESKVESKVEPVEVKKDKEDKRTTINNKVDRLSQELQKFTKGDGGAVSSKVRSTPEYKKAKKEYDIAFKELQKFNKETPKDVKNKLSKERREKKIAENQAKETELQEKADKKAEETYTPEEIVNTKDPVDVLLQAKNRRKKSTEAYIRQSDKLSNTQKQKFREESAKINKLVKQLEAEIIEKGAKEEKGIKEFTNRVVEGLQSAKTRLEKDGLTYSFILPVTPKMLSKALDVGIAAVKKTSSAVIGLNRFKNSIMLQLKIKQLTKKQEKELDDFFNRNYNITNKDVVNFAKEVVKQKKLDINGFVKEMKEKPDFSKYKREELESLYRNSLKELTPKEKAEFTKEASKETKQTQEQVKKDIKKVEDVSVEPKSVTKQTKDILNNIKDKVTQYNRGISAGKKESKKESQGYIKEFDKFLKDNSGLGKILSNQKTLRLTSNIKNAVTLERAIERIEKLVNDKALREESFYRDGVRKKIQAVTSVVESSQGRRVAKQKYKVTGGKAADLVDRLDRINTHVKKSNKSEKYEVEQQEKIEQILEKIHDINSLTDAKKDVNRKSQEKELDKLQKELSELEFSQLHNKTTKELEALLKDVTEISLTASTAKEKQKAEDGARFQERREKAKEVLGGGKKLSTGSKKKKPERGQDFWDFVEDNNLQTVFKKLAVRSKGQYFIENFYKEYVKKSEDAEIKDHQEHITKWTNDVSKIFDVKPEKVDIAVNKLRLEKDSGIELINKEGVKDKLNEITEMQLLAKWMESKDMANKSNLDNMGWTKENLDKLDKFLTPQTKKFGEYLFKEYQQSYDKYNETYKKMFGVSMPTAGEFYSPRFIEGKGGKEINANDVLDNNFNNHVRTANNQHTTKRINNSEPLAYHDASMTFWKYKQTMEKFHHYSNTVRELNAVFGDGGVRDYMREFHGSAYVKVMDYYMDVLSGNFRTKYDSGLGELVNNLTGGILFLKPAIGVKQTFSTLLYGTQMPTRKFVPGLLKFGQGGIVDIKSGTFWKSRDYAFMDVTRSINPRNVYQKGKIRQGVEKLGKKTGTTKVTDQMIIGGIKYANFMRRFVNPVNSMFIRWGDKVGIGWGGQVYADYQYKQYIKEINKETGKKHTHKEAHDKALNDFEIFAEASQQSSRATNISMIRGSNGDVGKAFTMFQSSQSQVNQIGLMALREMKYKKNVKQNAKTFMAAHVVLGGLFALAGNSFKWDDEKQTWGMIMGNLEGTAGLGKALSITKNLILGSKGFQGGLSPLLDNMISAIKYKIKLNDLKEKSDDARFSLTMKPEERRKKYLEYQEKISENRKKLNLVLLQFGGVPAKGAVNLYEDIGTVYRNESENPIREILGFESDWTVGRELYDISKKGFMNPTEDDRKLHQLKREQKRLETKISKSYFSERENYQKEFDSNSKKIEKLINKK